MISALALVNTVLSMIAPSSPDQCTALFQSSQRLIPGLKPYVARIYPAGSDFLGVEYPAHNLTEFCRFGANYNTSSTSSIQFEVWLPTKEKWNGRFAHVGNGGDAGYLFYGDMGVALTKYGFAVAGTNVGHNGLNFKRRNVCHIKPRVTGNIHLRFPRHTDALRYEFDFGYRAVHLSTIFSKKITQEYYKKKPGYSYWLGCSSGGKQGLKEIQEFPEDYDGIAIGAPAQWWSRLTGYLMHVFNLNNNPVSPAEPVPATFFPIWAQEVLAQCDELDGVKDNIITEPRVCKPDTLTVVCGSPNPSRFVNGSTCITSGQAKTIGAVYQDWISTAGEPIFPALLPGSEAGWGFALGETPFPVAPDYFLYQVYNYTSVQPGLKVNETELQRITRVAETTDPGRINAINPNLRPFFRRGGKLLEYHGLADPLIPPGGSTSYYNKVRAYMNDSDLGKSYRLFLIPGMTHCGGGTGADGFGRPQQAEDYLGGLGQSPVFDRKHDAILALMDWVEKEKAPDSIIGASYQNGNKTQGVAFTRLFCPYPQEAEYMDGNTNNATSYRCK
ncbi:hypothetical protein FRC09_020757 [Ceratobasidium sp. 395]|nr:hypothetical protein FRC09_020757 [Ceratobasidium sp. 395]